MIANTILNWLMESSAQATVLIGMILFVRVTIGRWLTPQWRYLMWFLVALRLITPVTPESRWSIQNAFSGESEESRVSYQGFITTGLLTAETNADSPASYADSSQRVIGLNEIIVFMWLLGVLGFLTIMVRHGSRLNHLVARSEPVLEPSIQQVFSDCRNEVGVRTPVQLLISETVLYPALIGITRPVILLNRKTLHAVSPTELRHILLHELLHLKRRDITMGIFVAGVQAIFWFNPIVWFAFYRMRQDREAACDAAVIHHLGETEGQMSDYGRTLLKLADQNLNPQRLPLGAAGIIEGYSETGKRIVMICQYRKVTVQRSGLGFLLACFLVMVGFTSAQPGDPASVLLGPINKKNPGNKSSASADQITSRPFSLTVAENGGELVYHFDETTKNLSWLEATKNVVFFISGTTVTSAWAKYDVLEEKLTAKGPDLNVTLSAMAGARCEADSLTYWLKDDRIELIGNPKLYQTSKNGNVTVTSGETILIKKKDGKVQFKVSGSDK